MKMRPLDVWAKEQNFVAAVNAGMFDGSDPSQPDFSGITNRGFTKDYNHYNNSRATKAGTLLSALIRKTTAFRLFRLQILSCVRILKSLNKSTTP